MAGLTSHPQQDVKDWSKLKVEELRSELSGRGLPTNGRKVDLVARLKAEESGETGETGPSKGKEETSSKKRKTPASKNSKASNKKAKAADASEVRGFPPCSRGNEWFEFHENSLQVAAPGPDVEREWAPPVTDDNSYLLPMPAQDICAVPQDALGSGLTHMFSLVVFCSCAWISNFMKLISWNLNGLNAVHKVRSHTFNRTCANQHQAFTTHRQKGHLTKYVKEEKPDVICFQETKTQNSTIIHKMLGDEYPYEYWSNSVAKLGYAGTAYIIPQASRKGTFSELVSLIRTFSKIRPLSVSYGLDIDKHDQEGRVITTEFDNFYLVNTYIPNAGQKLER